MRYTVNTCILSWVKLHEDNKYCEHIHVQGLKTQRGALQSGMSKNEEFLVDTKISSVSVGALSMM